jgi:ABC-2 type transport system permease protein
MKRLLEIEFLKLRNFRAFWILMILYVVTMALMLLFLQGTMNSLFDGTDNPAGGLFRWSINAFPDNWHFLSYVAGFFTFILMIVVVFLVSSEFTYKTIRQNVINGMSRMEFLVGKLLLIAVVTIGCTLLVGVIVLLLGVIEGGISSAGIMFEKANFLAGYFVQTLGYLVIAFWLTLMVKRSGIAIGVLFIYTWFLENITRAFWDDNITRFLPVRSLNKLVQNPFIAILDKEVLTQPGLFEYGIAFFYIALFTGLSIWYMRNKDI